MIPQKGSKNRYKTNVILFGKGHLVIAMTNKT